MLFNEIIFGPIQSRRLGTSLGVNLLPSDGKLCSFDCIYCECGLNAEGKGSGLPSRNDILKAFEIKGESLKEEGIIPDVITFAGNGEPTLHPDFPSIIDDTIRWRNAFFPSAQIAVLSNATMIHRPEIVQALQRIDRNIQKVDSVCPETLRLIDRPNLSSFNIEYLRQHLRQFNNLIIQTLFLRGTVNGQAVDNTTTQELQGWLALIEELRPTEVMIYTLDRKAPFSSINKVPLNELQEIGKQVENLGIKTNIAG